MSKKNDYVPAPDVDFFNWQDNLVTYTTPKIVLWKITAADFTAVTAEQAIYVPLYNKIKNKGTRTTADVTAHREERLIYEKLLRNFTGQWLAKNKVVTDADRASLRITVKDTVRSSRPQITTKPVASILSSAGARIVIECRVLSDSSRPNMHEDADAIEVVYIVGIAAPANPAACAQSFISSKAKFSIQLDIADAGKKFYAFLRWKNSADDSKSGLWCNVIMITIGE